MEIAIKDFGKVTSLMEKVPTNSNFQKESLQEYGQAVIYQAKEEPVIKTVQSMKVISTKTTDMVEAEFNTQTAQFMKEVLRII